MLAIYIRERDKCRYCALFWKAKSVWWRKSFFILFEINFSLVKIYYGELLRKFRRHLVISALNYNSPCQAANSSFLKPAKKVARHTDRPKVRFADDIIVNGQERTEGSSPLLLSPGVLRIHLENSQTKSFQFLPDTTAGDAVSAICEKLGFRNPNLFSLVLTPHSEDLQSTG